MVLDNKVDLVSDLSKTICKEQIPIEWILSYMSVPLWVRALGNYMSYLFSGNPKYFYDTLKDVPVKPFDFVKALTPNTTWDLVIKNTKPKRVGIVTQDDYAVASAYLETQKERFKTLGIEECVILASNYAKHSNGVYTGESEINVSPGSLLNILMQCTSDVPILGDGPVSSILDRCPKQYDALRRRFINVQPSLPV